MQALRAAGADHDVLAVKRNQRILHAKVRAAFEDTGQGVFTPAVQEGCEIVERNGGRRERRTGPVLGGPGLRSLIRVRTARHGPRATASWAGPRHPGCGERPAPHPGRAVPGG